MRNGFKSSRGAILGTIGGVPICLVGVVGFATVAIGVGPFVNSFYRSRRLQIVRCTWPEFLKLSRRARRRSAVGRKLLRVCARRVLVAANLRAEVHQFAALSQRYGQHLS